MKSGYKLSTRPFRNNIGDLFCPPLFRTTAAVLHDVSVYLRTTVEDLPDRNGFPLYFGYKPTIISSLSRSFETGKAGPESFKYSQRL